MLIKSQPSRLPRIVIVRYPARNFTHFEYTLSVRTLPQTELTSNTLNSYRAKLSSSRSSHLTMASSSQPLSPVVIIEVVQVLRDFRSRVARMPAAGALQRLSETEYHLTLLQNSIVEIHTAEELLNYVSGHDTVTRARMIPLALSYLSRIGRQATYLNQAAPATTGTQAAGLTSLSTGNAHSSATAAGPVVVVHSSSTENAQGGTCCGSSSNASHSQSLGVATSSSSSIKDLLD